MVAVAKAGVGRQQAAGQRRKLVFLGHADPAVQLDRFLGHLPPNPADEGFRGGHMTVAVGGIQVPGQVPDGRARWWQRSMCQG